MYEESIALKNQIEEQKVEEQAKSQVIKQE